MTLKRKLTCLTASATILLTSFVSVLEDISFSLQYLLTVRSENPRELGYIVFRLSLTCAQVFFRLKLVDE